MKWMNRLIARVLPYMPESFVWLFSKRYIAGKTLEDALRISHALNNKGIKVTLDLLGEFQTNISRIEEYKQKYLEAIQMASEENIDSSFSLKPTMFGLLQDENRCYDMIREIILKARQLDRHVTMDIEDSECTDAEIGLFAKLYDEFPSTLGFAVQAYLFRTQKDLEKLNSLAKPGYPLKIRICKGIYIEPASIAYKDHKSVNRNFMACLEYMVKNNFYPEIATHDKELVEGAIRLIKQHGVSPADYEFQMLYGVTPRLRDSIVKSGHNMRVYVPFGHDWFNYSVRRLQENPHMVMQIVSALFIRK